MLKNSTKTSLSDRFAKVQSRISQRQQQQQQQQTPIRDRRNVGGLSTNALSINTRRVPIGTRKAVTDSANRPRIGGSLRGGVGGVASRLQKRPLRSNVQDFMTDSPLPVRGAPSGRRGYQRGGRRGGTRGGATHVSTPRAVGNTATRGFGKRGKSTFTPKKEDLDKELESYMSKTKGFLDDQLESYHSQK